MADLWWLAAGWAGLSLVIWAGAALAERVLGDRLSPAVKKWGWFFLVLKMAVPLGVGLPLLGSLPSPWPGARGPAGQVGLVEGGVSERSVPAASPGGPGVLETAVPPAVPAAEPQGSQAPDPVGSWEALPVVFGLVWLGGAAFLGFRGLGARRRWNRFLAEAREPSARVQALVGAVKDRLGVTGGPVPLVLEGLGSPVLAGLVRPRLVLPAEDRYTDGELTWMADHELRHWTAGDGWVVGAVQVLTAVFWFLPGLWLASPRLVGALEADCDRRVLRGRDQESLRSYALTLWKVLDADRGGLRAGMAMAPGARQLGDRFRSLGRPVRRSVPALVLAAALVLVTGVWGLEPSPSPAAPVPAEAPGLPPLPGRFTKTFPLPAETVGALTTPYGWACHPFSGEWYLHTGEDLAAGSGTPVLAAWPGTVVREDFEADGLGYSLEIDHGDGVLTRYAHLREAGKPVGTKVGRGQVIGRVGATGLATGPHLHFEVLQGGQSRDPAPFLTLPARWVVFPADLEAAGAAVQAALGPGSPLGPGVRFWVTQGFGPLVHPVTGKPFFHPGLDLATRAGTPVRAPWAGTVKQVGDDPALEGFFLRLDHGNGWESSYSHLEALPGLKAGDRVGAGETLGRLGSTGQSTGPHLHWELRRHGMTVDPSPFLGASVTGQTPAASASLAPPPPGSPLASGTAFQVTQGFGPAVFPFTGHKYLHTGIDLAAPLKTPVVSPWAGKVAAKGYEGDGDGNYLVIDHGGGWMTRYTKLDRFPSLAPGAPVAAGQSVGLVGSTGLSTGPHLHWEVLHDGSPVDPASWMGDLTARRVPNPDDALVKDLSDQEVRHLKTGPQI